MNLAHRTMNNAAFNGLTWLFPLLLSFPLLPYIVNKLGSDSYGILTLVWTVTGYFAFLDLGLANAVVKFVAEYNSKGNSEKVNQVIGGTLLILSSFGAIGGLVLLIIAKYLVTKVLNVPTELISVAYYAFCISSVGYFATMLLSVFAAIPNGLNRYDISAIVSVSMGAATLLGNAFLLYLGFGLIEIVVFAVMVSFGTIFTYILILRKIYPALRVFPTVDFSALRKVMSFGLFSLLSRLAFLANYHADRLIIGVLLGVSWVTYYVIPFTLINRLTSLTIKLGSVIFPAISELQGQRRFHVIIEMYLTSSRIVIAISTAICLPLLVFGDRLLSLWMGQEFGVNCGFVVVLITAALYLSAFTNVPTFVADGLGKPRVSGIAALVNAILNISLAIPLAKHFGINGVGFSFLISNALVTFGFVYYVNNRVLQISFLVLMRKAYLKPLAAGCLFGPLFLVPADRIDNVFWLLIAMALTSLAYCAAALAIGAIPQTEQKIVIDYFRLVWRRV
jgi:O-antigen/teichoic acid export membrane protein